jgi:hypothetical protein
MDVYATPERQPLNRSTRKRNDEKDLEEPCEETVQDDYGEREPGKDHDEEEEATIQELVLTPTSDREPRNPLDSCAEDGWAVQP